MNCQQTSLADRGFQPCTDKATVRLWCPTWIGAEKGPMFVCETHANVFRPEENENAGNGLFYWGADADFAYQRAQGFYRSHDADEREQYFRLHAMIKRVGTHVFGHYYAVDGRMWAATMFGVVNVGPYYDVLQEMRECGIEPFAAQNEETSV